jgi:4-hydroxybenzoate polyprenyltransferase
MIPGLSASPYNLALVMIATMTSPIATIRTIAADIKLAHSVFALPFALLASFMAAAGANARDDELAVNVIDWGTFSGQLVLIVLAMVFARTVAMLANRLIDRELDARNPRTAGRAIPAGRLSALQAIGAIIVSAGLFLAVCAGFGMLYGNWWPAILALPVLAWIASYGYFKRFTSLCHFWLGSSLAISPLAAAIAINPSALADQPAIWLLSGMVLCWVAGFDVIYALQDIDIDRRDGLFSIPARYGRARALWMSRVMHLTALGCLVAAWMVDSRLGVVFGVGVAVVAVLLIYEHSTVARWGTTRIALAFFTLNGVISLILGTLGIIDVILGR